MEWVHQENAALRVVLRGQAAAPRPPKDVVVGSYWGGVHFLDPLGGLGRDGIGTLSAHHTPQALSAA